MKKIFTFICFLFLPMLVYSKSSYGVRTSVGQNFYFTSNDTINLPFYYGGIEFYNSEFPLTFFDIGYIGIIRKIRKNIDIYKDPDIKKTSGITGSLGYNFNFEPNGNFISIIPCLTVSFIDIEQNKYTSSNIIQTGIKCIISVGRNITSNLKIKFNISPQYNFFNYIYEYKEKSKEFYKYNDEDLIYEPTIFTYAESFRTFTLKSFCHDFGVSIIYTF